MTQSSIPADAAQGTAPRTDLWKPVLLRSAAALVFGAVTVFWTSPSVEVMGWAGGLYLLATGVVSLRAIPAAGIAPKSLPGKLLSAAGAVLAGAGFAVLLLHSDLLFGVIAALGLGVAGVLELAVVGEPHARLGERVVLAVRAQAGCDPVPALRAAARTALPPAAR
ncbi:MAG: hypothetical protein ACXVYB_01785, partial [Arthrobacter sp.]